MTMASTDTFVRLLGSTQFFDGIIDWNIILFVLVGCSIVSLTIFIERLVALRKAERDTNRFIIQVRQAINDGDVVAAMEVCERTGGSIAKITKAGLGRYNKGKASIESAMEVTGVVEIARLEKNAKVLSVLAHIAPLIGLLGTVLGFIQVFGEMRLSGLMDISATRIGGAMEYALITTAAGLVVAIPSTVAYNYLVSRIETFVLEIQTTSSEVVELLVQRLEGDRGIA